MKKILFILLCSVAFIGASAQTGKVSVNAGFLFPSTLNATLGYEYPLSYGNAVEVYGEVGNHWQKPVCHNFLKEYYCVKIPALMYYAGQRVEEVLLWAGGRI